jgi:hypothetical protein
MDDKAIIRSFESGFNMRIVVGTILAVVVVLGLIFFVARSFKGRDIHGGAAALTDPSTETVKVPPARPASGPGKGP